MRERGRRRNPARAAPSSAARPGSAGTAPGRRGAVEQCVLGRRLALAEPCEQPQLGRRQVDGGPPREPLVARPTLVVVGEPAERPLDLPHPVVVVRRLERLAGIRHPRGRAQRHLAQEPGEHERQRRDAGSRVEERRDRVGHCQSVGLAERLGQVRDHRRADLLRHDGTGRQAVDEVRRQLVGEDGAEDRDADRAADLAEESRGRARDAEVLDGTAFWRRAPAPAGTEPRPRPSTTM